MLIKSQYTPKLGKAVYPGDQELFDGGVQPVGFFEEEGAVPGQFIQSSGAPQPEPIPDAGISAAAPGYVGSMWNVNANSGISGAGAIVLDPAVPRNLATVDVDETSAGAPVPAIVVPENTLPITIGGTGVQQASYDAVPNPFNTVAPAYAAPNLLDAQTRSRFQRPVRRR